MYCTKCGKKNINKALFCKNCGNGMSENLETSNINNRPEPKAESRIINNSESTTRVKADKESINEENKIKLEKIFKNTGNTAVALSVFSVFATFVISLINNTSLIESLLGALIMFPFLIPYFYYGNKLKKEGINNLKYSLKISKGMFIYTIIFIIVNLLAGGIGFLWLFLLYYFYQSYKETKKLI